MYGSLATLNGRRSTSQKVTSKKIFAGGHMALHLCSLRGRRLFFVSFLLPLRLGSLFKRFPSKPPATKISYFDSFENSPIYSTKIPFS